MTVFFMCLRENFERLTKRKGKKEEGDLLANSDTDNSFSSASDATLIAAN